MNLLVVLGHPDATSFNASIAHAAKEELEFLGHQVVFHDLYQEGFDPLLPTEEIPLDGPVDPVVEKHCAELAEADGLVVVHPNWWGQPPAMLKGWVDRVFRAGVAYRFLESEGPEGLPEGLLKARVAVVFNTSNTSPEREAAVFGDPLENLWRTCLFDFCGIKEFYRRTFSVIVVSTTEQRKKWLDEVRETMRRLFPKV
jgi:NAD(P)H dehydrogenase (quinone)